MPSAICSPSRTASGSSAIELRRPANPAAPRTSVTGRTLRHAQHPCLRHAWRAATLLSHFAPPIRLFDPPPPGFVATRLAAAFVVAIFHRRCPQRADGGLRFRLGAAMNNVFAVLSVACLLMVCTPGQAAPAECDSMAATARLVARYRQLGGPLSDIASYGSIGSSKARRELAATIYREHLGEADAVRRAMQACGRAGDAPSQ
ncbi:hypothetical protein ACFOPN_07285 [Xanthomonas hyacinthi]